MSRGAGRRAQRLGGSVWLLALACGLGASPAALAGPFEIEGKGWRGGQHHGTRASAQGLSLASGARVGTWTITSPDLGAVDRLVTSLNARGRWPQGSEVRVLGRVRGASGWLSFGRYGRGARLPRSESPPERAKAARARVKIDTLVAEAPFRRLELRLVLRRAPGGASPVVARVALDAWRKTKAPAEPRAKPHAAWGKVLDVPRRSQGHAPPAIASRVCSPTSLGMVLAFHGAQTSTEGVARGVYDHGAELYGNWSLNVAHASELGFRATVRHLRSFSALEDEIAAGRPVVLSHRYAKGELSHAAVASTEGHLIVVVGFTAKGDVVVNDPAGNPKQGRAVRRVYQRSELWRTWQHNASGVVYTLRPSR